MDLTAKHCVPCKEGDPRLSEEKEEELKTQIPTWILFRDPSTPSGQLLVHKLRRQFTFKTFKDAIAFMNKVADIAEKEGHHPDIYIFYNKVQLDLYTHVV